MFLSVFFSSVYINGTGVILGMLTNDAVLGHYSAAEKIVRAVTYVFTPISQAFFPFISKMFMVNKEMGKLLFFKFLNIIAALAAVATIVVYFMSGWLVAWLSSRRRVIACWVWVSTSTSRIDNTTAWFLIAHFSALRILSCS